MSIIILYIIIKLKLFLDSVVESTIVDFSLCETLMMMRVTGPDPKVPWQGEPMIVSHCFPSSEDDVLRTGSTV